jgi:hypothetical protein
MRRRAIILAGLVGTATLAIPATAAAGPANDGASCVGVLTSFEAHIAPGFVGGEVSSAAPALRAELGAFVSGLARAHEGGFEGCLSLVVEE